MDDEVPDNSPVSDAGANASSSSPAGSSNDGSANSTFAVNDAKADSILNNVFGDSGDETVTDGGAPSTDEGESAEGQEPSADQAQTDPVDAILSQNQQAMLAQVVPSLLEAGIPKEVIGQWVKNDPKGLVAWVNGLQAKVGGQNQPVADAKADTAPVAPALDLDALVKPISEMIGDEAGAPLGEFGKAIFTGSLQAYEKAHANWRTREFKPVMDHVEKLTGVVESLMLRAARAESTAKYPDLAKPAQRDQVETKARKLFQTGDYESFDAAYDDACKLIFAPAAMKAQQAALAKTAQFKKAGGMTPSSNTGKPKLTAEQVADRVAEMSIAGKTPSEINAWKASVGHKD